MSYIEREKALKVVADIMSDCKVSHKHRALNRNIKQIPTADVVEVVRCKDCKEKYINADNNMRCRLSGRNIVEDDYCSKADKIVYCKDCKHLMFSDCYGECAEAHKGIVQPDDYCCYGERRENGKS